MANFFDWLKYSSLYDFLNPFSQKLELFKWRWRGKTFPTPHIVKQQIVKRYAIKYKITTFVETGTYLGVMVNTVKNLFESIYTIEIDRKLYQRASKKFKRYKQIKVLHGDSAKIFSYLLLKIKSPCLFWLDAHYSGGITGKGKNTTPVFDEISQILKHQVKNNVILIDDANLFNGKNGYPSLVELKKVLARESSGLKIRLEKNVIVITYINT